MPREIKPKTFPPLNNRVRNNDRSETYGLQQKSCQPLFVHVAANASSSTEWIKMENIRQIIIILHLILQIVILNNILVMFSKMKVQNHVFDDFLQNCTFLQKI